MNTHNKPKYAKHFLCALAVFCLCLTGGTAKTKAEKGVKKQGKYYFVGKPQEELFEYFGNRGGLADPVDGYDEVRCFSNGVINHYVDKTTTTIINKSVPTLVYLGQDINFFNGEIQRLDAVPIYDQQAAFNNTPAGSCYFTYEATQKSVWEPGTMGYYNARTGEYQGGTPGRSHKEYTYRLWKVDIVAEKKSDTQTLVAYTYNVASGNYYDANGAVIDRDRAQAIEAGYTAQGYKPRTLTSGFSLKAYIKYGSVVKVE